MSLIEMLHCYSHLPRQITNRNPFLNGLAKEGGGRGQVGGFEGSFKGFEQRD